MIKNSLGRNLLAIGLALALTPCMINAEEAINVAQNSDVTATTPAVTDATTTTPQKTTKKKKRRVKKQQKQQTPVPERQLVDTPDPVDPNTD